MGYLAAFCAPISLPRYFAPSAGVLVDSMDEIRDENKKTVLRGCCGEEHGGGICARCAGWATGASEPGSHSPAQEGRVRGGARLENDSGQSERARPQVEEAATSQPGRWLLPFFAAPLKVPEGRYLSWYISLVLVLHPSTTRTKVLPTLLNLSLS